MEDVYLTGFCYSETNWDAKLFAPQARIRPARWAFSSCSTSSHLAFFIKKHGTMGTHGCKVVTSSNCPRLPPLVQLQCHKSIIGPILLLTSEVGIRQFKFILLMTYCVGGFAGAFLGLECQFPQHVIRPSIGIIFNSKFSIQEQFGSRTAFETVEIKESNTSELEECRTMVQRGIDENRKSK